MNTINAMDRIIAECEKDMKRMKPLQLGRIHPHLNTATTHPNMNFVDFVQFVAGPEAANRIVATQNIPNVKEDSMYTETQEQKRYLEGRLYGAAEEKKVELKRAFGLLTDDTPSTSKEIVERIQAGKFVLPEDGKDRGYRSYETAMYNIEWRDPSVKKDEAGYEEAKKPFRQAVTDVKDAIQVKSAEEALTALKEFESKTFH